MGTFTTRWILELHRAGVRTRVIALTVGHSVVVVQRVICKAKRGARKSA